MLAQLGDLHIKSNVVSTLGGVYIQQGKIEEALPYLEKALTRSEQMEDTAGMSQDSLNLAEAYIQGHDLLTALDLLESALPLARAASDKRCEGFILQNMGRVYDVDDAEQAATYYEQALMLFGETKDQYGKALTSCIFGALRARQGEIGEASMLLQAGVAYLREIGHADAEKYAALLQQLQQ